MIILCTQQGQAISTFNFLNAERRLVAAAIIPPDYIEQRNDQRDVEDTFSIGVDTVYLDKDTTITDRLSKARDNFPRLMDGPQLPRMKPKNPGDDPKKQPIDMKKFLE